MLSPLLAAAIMVAPVANAEPEFVQSEDQFVAAIDNDSTDTYFVLVTVTDAQTGRTKSGCVTANLLLGAIHDEHGLNYDDASLAKARQLALASRQHHFAFRNRDALANISFDALDKQDQAACELVRAGYTAYRADVSGQIVSSKPPPTAWPALPTSGFVSGRIATEDDLKQGNGVFRFVVEGKPITTPTTKVRIPQFAYLVEANGNRRPVVVVQAEMFDGQLTFGLRDADGKEFIAAEEEVELLGPTHP